MRNRTTMNISLTPELESFVDSRVSSGRYQSASEVVRAALRLLETEEQDREAHLAELRQKIRLGLDQIQRGEVFDGEAVFDELNNPAAFLIQSRKPCQRGIPPGRDRGVPHSCGSSVAFSPPDYLDQEHGA